MLYVGPSIGLWIAPPYVELSRNSAVCCWLYRETSCLRADQSGCFPPGHKFYDVTHNGLDAMAVRCGFVEIHSSLHSVYHLISSLTMSLLF